MGFRYRYQIMASCTKNFPISASEIFVPPMQWRANARKVLSFPVSYYLLTILIEFRDGGKKGNFLPKIKVNRKIFKVFLFDLRKDIL